MATSGALQKQNSPLAIEADDIGVRYLCVEELRIAAVPHRCEIGTGILSNLIQNQQEHVLRVDPALTRRATPLAADWLDYVYDAAQDELVAWIGEHTGFEWNVAFEQSDDDAFDVLYSFANGADAVAFKLRWCDRIKG